MQFPMTSSVLQQDLSSIPRTSLASESLNMTDSKSCRHWHHLWFRQNTNDKIISMHESNTELK